MIADDRRRSVCCRDGEPELLGPEAEPAAFARSGARRRWPTRECDSVVCAAVNAFDRGTEEVIVALTRSRPRRPSHWSGCSWTSIRRSRAATSPTVLAPCPGSTRSVDAMQALVGADGVCPLARSRPRCRAAAGGRRAGGTRVVNRVLAAAARGSRADRSETAELLRGVRDQARAAVRGVQPGRGAARSPSGLAGMSC